MFHQTVWKMLRCFHDGIKRRYCKDGCIFFIFRLMISWCAWMTLISCKVFLWFEFEMWKEDFSASESLHSCTHALTHARMLQVRFISSGWSYHMWLKTERYAGMHVSKNTHSQACRITHSEGRTHTNALTNTHACTVLTYLQALYWHLCDNVLDRPDRTWVHSRADEHGNTTPLTYVN